MTKQMSCLYAFLFIALAGCGGAKVLKKPVPLQTTKPLMVASDTRLVAILDWVIVRAGPGTWVKNADWDEYLLRFENLSGSPIEISSVRVFDSLGTGIAPQTERRALVRGTKQTKRRYRDADIKVKAGIGTGTMLAAGTAVGVAGYGMAFGSAAGGGFGAAGGAGAGAGAAGAVLIAAPVIAFIGIKRGVNNKKVHREIVRRQTPIPQQLPSSGKLSAHVFFPLTPSPSRLEVAYECTETGDKHILLINTLEALDGLHLIPDKESMPISDEVTQN